MILCTIVMKGFFYTSNSKNFFFFLVTINFAKTQVEMFLFCFLFSSHSYLF